MHGVSATRPTLYGSVAVKAPRLVGHGCLRLSPVPVPCLAAARRGPCCRTRVVNAATDKRLEAVHQVVSPDIKSQVVSVYDFLVIGSGIAGLTFALQAAKHGRVAVVTKANIQEGCTQYAQGGICAVLDATDSVENHIRDTLAAGAYLNDYEVVDIVCREGPARVLQLAALGAQFTRCRDGRLHLTREGGHSHNRIAHAADMTGFEIERALVVAVKSSPNIDVYEHHFTTDLVVNEVGGIRHCLGVDVLDTTSSSMKRFAAPVTLLATGGAGQAYPVTTNPTVTTGDGMAMAHRAKGGMANMEFVQFHPTSLYTGQFPKDRVSLISEAVRGEGGRLYNLAGERFMRNYDDRLELATRDVVARSIYDQMLTLGDSHVLLDISYKASEQILSHFPSIAANCRTHGIDITKDPIPVVPAQHYICGGVKTGLSGETNIAGLYACGEVACTGLHGANRLASNSLLEGLVFAHRAVGPAAEHAEHVVRHATPALQYAVTSADFSGSRAACPLRGAAAEWVQAKRCELTETMWQHVGIVRSQQGLKKAFRKLAALYVEAKAMAESYGMNVEIQELRNLVTVAELIVSSALQRRESRGGHYCTDFPSELEEQRHDTVISQSLKRRYDLSRLTMQLKVPSFTSTLRPATPEKNRELSVRVSKET